MFHRRARGDAWDTFFLMVRLHQINLADMNESGKRKQLTKNQKMNNPIKIRRDFYQPSVTGTVF